MLLRSCCGTNVLELLIEKGTFVPGTFYPFPYRRPIKYNTPTEQQSLFYAALELPLVLLPAIVQVIKNLKIS